MAPRRPTTISSESVVDAEYFSRILRRTHNRWMQCSAFEEMTSLPFLVQSPKNARWRFERIPCRLGLARSCSTCRWRGTRTSDQIPPTVDDSPRGDTQAPPWQSVHFEQPSTGLKIPKSATTSWFGVFAEIRSSYKPEFAGILSAGGSSPVPLRNRDRRLKMDQDRQRQCPSSPHSRKPRRWGSFLNNSKRSRGSQGIAGGSRELKAGPSRSPPG